LRCALDVGGDKGQFFPDFAIQRRLVFDISDKPLLAGTERLTSLSALTQKPDLVIAAHILEHLSDPRALLSEIRTLISPTGFLYVEVPLDKPRLRSWHCSSRYRAWINRVSRHRWSFIPCDFATGLAKQMGWKVPRLGIVKQSEHINFFTSSSLGALLESCGFEVTAERQDPGARVGAFRLGRLGVAALPAAVVDT
jgi:hypothetical protein